MGCGRAPIEARRLVSPSRLRRTATHVSIKNKKSDSAIREIWEALPYSGNASHQSCNEKTGARRSWAPRNTRATLHDDDDRYLEEIRIEKIKSSCCERLLAHGGNEACAKRRYRHIAT
jgi:hypothetical protein